MIDRKTVEAVVAFHGHMCPGLAVGIRAAEAALREIGPHAVDEEIVCAVETDMCAVDAIQYMTGCTFGKGNLIYRDHGKNAFTFWRRSDGRAVRIRTRHPGVRPHSPEAGEVFAEVRSGALSKDEEARHWEDRRRRAHEILEAPEELVLEIHEIHEPAPSRARVHASIDCADCAESTMETRIRIFQSRQLCPACFARMTAGRA